MSISEPGIALLTDFGVSSPYVGQLQITLREQFLNRFMPIVELISDLPQFRPDLAAYLIPALVRNLADSWIFLCVVDPGVGSDRRALVLKADNQWFIGPDNGLLSIVAQRAEETDWWSIPIPEGCSSSFHGRDVFAPATAQIVSEDIPAARPISDQGIVGLDWPEDLYKVIYRDGYGNLMTGIQSDSLSADHRFFIGAHILSEARTFSDVSEGCPFWYKNALGLVEFAANKRPVDQLLGLAVGDDLG